MTVTKDNKCKIVSDWFDPDENKLALVIQVEDIDEVQRIKDYILGIKTSD